MALKLITPPATEPITLADVEAQIQATLPVDQETLVNGYISAIRQRGENEMRRAMITQTWDLVLDAFPGSTGRNPFAALEIPLPPLQSVVSVKYLATDGTLTTLAAGYYVVDLDSTPGRVMPAYGKTWPATLDYPGAVRVQFVAGYALPVYPAFDVLAVYTAGDAVLYTNGKSYRAKATTVAGTLPTDATKWAVISEVEAVPQCIKNWLLLNVASMYENRESLTIGTGGVIELSTLADSLLDPERWEVRI